MTNINTRPPIINELSMEDRAWIDWFTNVGRTLSPPNRDSGSFEPNFSNLATVGDVSISANFVRNGELLHFDVLIKPEPGATSSSTFGTTFFTLPSLLIEEGGDRDPSGNGFITSLSNGFVSAVDVTTPTDLNSGYVQKGSLRVFTPSWGPLSGDIAINGFTRIEGI